MVSNWRNWIFTLTNRIRVLLVLCFICAQIYVVLNYVVRGSTSKSGRGRSDYEGFYLSDCNCQKYTSWEHLHLRFNQKSFCSEEADWKGQGQRIISYSLFNDSNTKDAGDQYSTFVNGIYKNLNQMKTLYPGWSMRIYSNFDLCPEFCTYACLDEITWCDVRRRNSSLFLSSNLENINPSIWRLALPLGDPTVDIFLSRDLDSWITEREQEIVTVWMGTEFIFHAARDDDGNFQAIAPGTFSVKNYALPSAELESIRNEFISKGMNNTNTNTTGDLDEDLLQTLIFEKYPTRILIHDSYTCNNQSISNKVVVPTFPFPKQRKGNTRIGLKFRDTNTFEPKECPWQCRPSYGKNWTYC